MALLSCRFTASTIPVVVVVLAWHSNGHEELLAPLPFSSAPSTFKVL